MSASNGCKHCWLKVQRGQNEWRFALLNEYNSIIPEDQSYHIMHLGPLESAKIYPAYVVLNAQVIYEQEEK